MLLSKDKNTTDDQSEVNNECMMTMALFSALPSILILQDVPHILCSVLVQSQLKSITPKTRRLLIKEWCKLLRGIKTRWHK
jgi:hypothetical protein